jgi:hypothetical protein
LASTTGLGEVMPAVIDAPVRMRFTPPLAVSDTLLKRKRSSVLAATVVTHRGD